MPIIAKSSHPYLLYVTEMHQKLHTTHLDGYCAMNPVLSRRIRNARHFQYAHYTLIVFVLEIQCKLMFCVEVRSFSLEANALGAKPVARLVRALK